MSSLCAIVVLYNPDVDLLRRNLAAFVDDVDHILLWRNSSFDESSIQDFGEKVEFCGDESNHGISHALNFAWHFAKSNGYDYIMTMDQDSLWENFGSFYRNILLSDAPFGIYGPVVNSRLPDVPFREVDLVITSGMIIPISLLDNVGGFEEDFFVGCVDYEI
ncbi:MAG: hypothetical protein K6F25_00460 [Bacteroidales bacterium]|nr:hypothetical protein [Bacteroidales bacterium]